MAGGQDYGTGEGRGWVALVNVAAGRAGLLAPPGATSYPYAVQAVTFARDGTLWVGAGQAASAGLRIPALDAYPPGGAPPPAARPPTVTGAPKFIVDVGQGRLAVGTSSSDLALLDPDGAPLARLLEAMAVLEARGTSVPTLNDGVAFADRWLIVASARSAEGTADDDALLVYDLERLDPARPEPAWTVRELPDAALAVDVSPDGRLILVAMGNGKLAAYPFCPR